jgi:hypothetical protein
LTWQPASDDIAPSSQIRYDVFYPPTPHDGDFSRPNWTTAAGVTSFWTPGLPSHASARDAAGTRTPTQSGAPESIRASEMSTLDSSPPIGKPQLVSAEDNILGLPRPRRTDCDWVG